MKEKIKLHFERIQTRNDITRNYNSQAANMTSLVTVERVTAKNSQDPDSRLLTTALLNAGNRANDKVHWYCEYLLSCETSYIEWITDENKNREIKYPSYSCECISLEKDNWIPK